MASARSGGLGRGSSMRLEPKASLKVVHACTRGARLSCACAIRDAHLRCACTICSTLGANCERHSPRTTQARRVLVAISSRRSSVCRRVMPTCREGCSAGVRPAAWHHGTPCGPPAGCAQRCPVPAPAPHLEVLLWLAVLSQALQQVQRAPAAQPLALAQQRVQPVHAAGHLRSMHAHAAPPPLINIEIFHLAKYHTRGAGCPSLFHQISKSSRCHSSGGSVQPAGVIIMRHCKTDPLCG